MVVLINAAWNIFIESLTSIIGLGLDDSSNTKVQVKWIDDSFYSTMCSAKDALATSISIFTSVINFIVQSITARPVTYLEMNAQKVDSNFQAMFTMILTRLNDMLFSIGLGIFYPFFAMQKVAICETNSVMAVIDKLGFHVTLGIPEIQNMSNNAVGRCLTQLHTENTKSITEGNNPKGFQEIAASIVPMLAGAAIQSFLEQVKHPIDAAFTWCIGVIKKLQDLIQTIDMAHCKLPDFYMQVPLPTQALSNMALIAFSKYSLSSLLFSYFFFIFFSFLLVRYLVHASL